jgi:hypothetical protein
VARSFPSHFSGRGRRHHLSLPWSAALRRLPRVATMAQVIRTRNRTETCSTPRMFRDFYPKANTLCAQVFEAYLSSVAGVPTATRLMDRLKPKHTGYRFSSLDLDSEIVVVAQPPIGSATSFSRRMGVTDSASADFMDTTIIWHRRIPQDILLSWWDETPAVRCPLVGSVIPAFGKAHNSNKRS